MWRIFCFLQLAQLLESLEYCDESVWFPCEAKLENNMGWKRQGRSIIEETASDTNALMVGIDGITTGLLMENIFLKKGELHPDQSQLQLLAHAACAVLMVKLKAVAKLLIS